MKFTLADSRLLKESVNVISELVNEVTFKLTKNGMELVAIDPANVAMIDFKLMAGAFAEYEAEKDTEISLNLDNLKAVLKRAKPEDSIAMSLEKGRMKVELIGDGRKTFNLSLIDYDREAQKLPSLKFNAKIMMPSSKFDDAISDMSVASDSVALVSENGKFLMKSEGNLSDAKVEFPNASVSLGKEGEVIAKYAIEYLAKMSKASKLTEEVGVSYSNDYPLKLEYNVNGKLYLGFVLAPRVSND
ncbi:MAG: proliferating cell nuclear antigen (pcna) [Candidatus Nanoarchaeia archaeon]|nr:proliferating cell nuclear antigen (pcna) [Candidatus Nanoarchaeia archaeon]